MDLGKLSIDELMKKAQKYERQKEVHNKKMKKYRETHLEHAREWGRKQGKAYYWRRKGFEIDENGNKIPINKIEIIEDIKEIEIIEDIKEN